MQLVAYAIMLAVLPPSIWRLPAVFDGNIGIVERMYVLTPSIVPEVPAFASFGLMARWGEVWPRWIPFLRGPPGADSRGGHTGRHRRGHPHGPVYRHGHHDTDGPHPPG